MSKLLSAGGSASLLNGALLLNGEREQREEPRAASNRGTSSQEDQRGWQTGGMVEDVGSMKKRTVMAGMRKKKYGRNTHKRRRGKIQHEEVEKVEAAIIAAAQKEKQK